MKFSLTLGAGLVAAIALASTAMGGGHADKAIEAAVKARQAQMQLYAFNLGLLGNMAKGTVEYDAAAASGAAGNLAALSRMNQSRYWPQGSDTESFGEGTRALPAIWQEGSKAGEIGKEFGMAAAAMEDAAGNGLDALRGAIGAVGKTCGACHDDYRQPK